MKYLTLLLFAAAFLVSCSRKKKEDLVNYNDHIVNIMEQADRIMKSWNSSDIMTNYTENKGLAQTKITGLQDSLRDINAVSKDDTLRLSGISILNGYMQAFSLYDTIYSILSDSLYLKEDSVRVQNLLMTNKNMIEQESKSFAEIQKRFATRYELDFMQ